MEAFTCERLVRGAPELYSSGDCNGKFIFRCQVQIWNDLGPYFQPEPQLQMSLKMELAYLSHYNVNKLTAVLLISHVDYN